MTIDEALDKNLWSLLSTYLDYDAFGVSEDSYNDVYNFYDDPNPAYIYMDMLTTMFAPQIISVSATTMMQKSQPKKIPSTLLTRSCIRKNRMTSSHHI